MSFWLPAALENQIRTNSLNLRRRYLWWNRQLNRLFFDFQNRANSLILQSNFAPDLIITVNTIFTYLKACLGTLCGEYQTLIRKNSRCACGWPFWPKVWTNEICKKAKLRRWLKGPKMIHFPGAVNNRIKAQDGAKNQRFAGSILR